MRRVLDASVALKWVIVEPDSDKAIQLRDEYRNAIHELIAPEIFALECAYALTKKHRQKLIPDARPLWDDIMLDSPAYHPILSLLDRAVEISIMLRHNVHDCVYVALAEREGRELVTSDQRLLSNLQPTFSFIRDLATI
jgi:predicted nucleic acid-binding protein